MPLYPTRATAIKFLTRTPRARRCAVMVDLASPDDSVPPHPVGMRTCNRCNISKPASEFYVKKKETGLLMAQCKRCVCADRKKYSEEHPEKIWGNKPENKEKKLRRYREAYAENPDKYRAWALESYYRHRDEILEKKREDYQENREHEIARSSQYNKEHPEVVKAWKDANPDKIKAAQDKYKAANPDAHIISAAARRARKKGAKCGRLKNGFRDRLLEWQKHKCVYCPTPIDLKNTHVDHIIALSRGGPHIESNLQLLCKKCNLRKHAKHPLDFAAEMGIVKHPTLIPI